MDATNICQLHHSPCVQVLLFGEYHDDPVAHSAQLALFRCLLQTNGYNTSRCRPSHSSFNRTFSRKSHTNSNPGWHDPRFGFTGSPNLWTALHNDPHLFSSPAKPAGQEQPATPDLTDAVTTSSKPPPPVTSYNPFSSSPTAYSQPSPFPSLTRQSAPPPQQTEHAATSSAAAPDPQPNTFQSLSGAKPGVVSACLSSSLGGPRGGPSMTSAAANAAAADAVRPMIRSGVSYMSQSFSNLYGLLTARRAPHAADDPSPASITSPPSVASDLDSLADHTHATDRSTDEQRFAREPSGQAAPSPLSHCATPRTSPPRTPTPSVSIAAAGPALDRRPATAPNPRHFTGPPIAAAGPHHPHAHVHALPYSTWIWSHPDACSHPDLHLYDMDSLTTTAATDAAKVCTAGSKLGLPLTKEFYASYQRSPLATEAEGQAATNSAPRTPLAAAAAAAASAVASKTMAEASGAAAGAATSLSRPLTATDTTTPDLPRGDAGALDRITRGNGLSLAYCGAVYNEVSCNHAHATAVASAGEAVPLHSQLGNGLLHACHAMSHLTLAWPAALLVDAAASAAAPNSAGGGQPSVPGNGDGAVPGALRFSGPAGDTAEPGAAAAGVPPRREVILSLEMFERDVQHVVDEYCAGTISSRDLLVVRFSPPACLSESAPALASCASGPILNYVSMPTTRCWRSDWPIVLHVCTAMASMSTSLFSCCCFINKRRMCSSSVTISYCLGCSGYCSMLYVPSPFTDLMFVHLNACPVPQPPACILFAAAVLLPPTCILQYVCRTEGRGRTLHRITQPWWMQPHRLGHVLWPQMRPGGMCHS